MSGPIINQPSLAYDSNNGWIKTGKVAPFGEQQVAEFSPLIELDASNGLSTSRRDTIITSNSGSISSANAEHILSTGTTSSSSAALRTKERGRYQPGIEGLPGLAVRRPNFPTNDQKITWGYYDDLDGMFFGEDSTGIFVQHRHNGIDEPKVYQQNWNGEDKLDGNGPTGIKLDLTKTNIFRFPYVAYGGGPITFDIETTDSKGRPVIRTVHTIGSLINESVLSQWKLPIRADANNGTTSEDVKLYVGGRQFAVLGRYDPNRRTVPQDRGNVTISSGTVEPLVSFRKKSDRTSYSKSVKVFSGSVTSDQTGRIKIYIGPTLSNANPQDLTEVDPNETACETDISADGLSNGDLLFSEMFSSQGKNKIDAAGVKALGQDIPEDTWVTLAFENTSGNSATVNGSFSVEEEW